MYMPETRNAPQAQCALYVEELMARWAHRAPSVSSHHISLPPLKTAAAILTEQLVLTRLYCSLCTGYSGRFLRPFVTPNAQQAQCALYIYIYMCIICIFLYVQYICIYNIYIDTCVYNPKRATGAGRAVRRRAGAVEEQGSGLSK